jgi:hypothetical protein
MKIDEQIVRSIFAGLERRAVKTWGTLDWPAVSLAT